MIVCLGLMCEYVCVVGIVVGCNLILIVILCYCVVGVDGVFMGYVGGLLCKVVLLWFEGYFVWVGECLFMVDDDC